MFGAGYEIKRILEIVLQMQVEIKAMADTIKAQNNIIEAQTIEIRSRGDLLRDIGGTLQDMADARKQQLSEKLPKVRYLDEEMAAEIVSRQRRMQALGYYNMPEEPVPEEAQ